MYAGVDGEYYLRHKDAFRLDKNNIRVGQKLRKMTAIIYLNPDLESVAKEKGSQLGLLRIYLKNEIIDVVPHMGRCIIFTSEKVEHEVKPTKGY